MTATNDDDDQRTNIKGTTSYHSVRPCGHLHHLRAPRVGRQDSEDVPRIRHPTRLDVVDGRQDLQEGGGDAGARFRGDRKRAILGQRRRVVLPSEMRLVKELVVCRS